MDRFVLAELVRELALRVVGMRARGVAVWDRQNLFIALGTKDGPGLVVSLTADAPGLYLGLPPSVPSRTRSPARLTKLLTGSELVAIGSPDPDRVVHMGWRRTKPSGKELRLELVVEWLGTRNAAYLIDGTSREVLDLFATGSPRWTVGQIFEPPRPPSSPYAPEPDPSFLERLHRARQRDLEDRRAVREASGLSPLLADEVVHLHSERGLPIDEALAAVRSRLRDPRPFLYPPRGDFRTGGVRYRLSPIGLDGLGEGETYPTWNDAASAFIQAASRLAMARRRLQSMRARLAKRAKKGRTLLKNLESDYARLPDSDQLRRWGEVLLAGMAQARRVEGGVEVPDPYQSTGEWTRVPLDPRFDLARNAQRYFQRARKVDTGRERVGKRLEEARNELHYLETMESMLDSASEEADLEPLEEELRQSGVLVSQDGEMRAGKSKMPTPLGPRRFVGLRGSIILAGRSARSNESLTFEIAQPEEMWFHAAQSAGAHVVVRGSRGWTLGREDIVEAAGVAAYYSKSRGSTSAEVVYTLRKHVRKIRGAPPGTVRLERYRSIRVRPGLPAASDPDAKAGDGRERGS